jgi:hypothetical protein
VADGQGQRVGGVGGPGSDLEAEDAGDHRRHLGLVGAAGAGDRGLDLGRRVEDDGDAALGRREQRDGGRVRGRHDGADVGVGEDPLDGDDLGLEAGQPRVELALEEDQPLPRVAVARRAHDPDGHHRGPPRPPVDDTEAAAGQAGVDSEHAHERIPSGPGTRCRRMRG